MTDQPTNSPIDRLKSKLKAAEERQTQATETASARATDTEPKALPDTFGPKCIVGRGRWFLR
jgi:hypothetical protein